MNLITVFNISLFFLSVNYTLALEVKKALAHSSRLTAQAAVDPWINVTRIPKGGDATSQVFGECLKSSRRVEYKPSSVVSPSKGFTYWRYELGHNGKNSGPSTWDKVLKVDDIFDCADAAADYRLFRFEGNVCSLSNKTFLHGSQNPVQPGHPEGNKDVIFINFEIPPSSCVGNFVVINGTCVNIIEFETPLVSDVGNNLGENTCEYQFSSNSYSESDALPFSTVQNYLRTNKITGEFRVGVYMDMAYPRLQWRDSELPVNPSFIDASSYVNYENKMAVVISSDLNYKLVLKDYEAETRGVICAKLME